MNRKLIVEKLFEDEFCRSIFKSSYDNGDGFVFVFGLSQDTILTGAALMVWEYQSVVNLGIAMESSLVSLFQDELHRLVDCLTDILSELNSANQGFKVDYTPRLRNILYGPPIAN